MKEPPYDVIIVGQGLAGTMLAWRLHWLGKRVLCLDRDEASTCSKVAAGIVTPVTGKRVALSWRVDEFHPAAMEFYARTARELGRDFFHPMRQARLFQNDDERARHAKKRDDPAFAPWLSNPAPRPLVSPEFFRVDDPSDGFEMRHSGRLDTRGWLAASAAYFAERGMRRSADVPPEALDVKPDRVTLPDGTAGRTLVFCQGHEAAANPFFSWVRWKSARGDILTLRIPGLTENRIIHRGGWLMPLGDGLHWRAGSTYFWDDLDAGPSASGRALLEERLRGLLRLPFTVTDHQAGVRPIIRESKALMGRHPARPSLAFFNGLGSKGTLHGPLCAAKLAEHLALGAPLEDCFDLRANG